MARGINKVILIGNLGADPETRAMPSGTTVANLRVATSESWRDKQTGEQQERTEWHRVALFGRLAEIAGRSEEHTSELQSRFDLVCRLLLEKKKAAAGGASRWRHGTTGAVESAAGGTSTS